MLHEVSGDILLTQASTIAHGVAPGDHMNNGLAFSLRKDWPAMHKDFRHFSHATNPHPGTLWSWAGANENGSWRSSRSNLPRTSRVIPSPRESRT